MEAIWLYCQIGKEVAADEKISQAKIRSMGKNHQGDGASQPALNHRRTAKTGTGIEKLDPVSARVI